MIEFIKMNCGGVIACASASLTGVAVSISQLNQVLTALSATAGLIAGIISIAINIRKALREKRKYNDDDNKN